LSFVVLWIGLFTGWGIFYVVMSLRNMNKMVKSVRKKLDLVDQILEIVKKKVEMTANYLPPLMEGAGKLVQHFREKRAKPATKKKSKRTKKTK